MERTISIIIPVYNEADNLSKLYDRLSRVIGKLEYKFEFIFVDDGSTDNSFELLKSLNQKDSRVKVISFSRNFGNQSAISAGLDYCNGNATVVIESDLQDPPEVIPEMLERWEAGFKVVNGKKKKSGTNSVFKKWTSKAFYRILDIITEISIPKDASMFKLLDSKVVEELNKLKENHRYFPGLVSWVGFSQTEVEYERNIRYEGETKFSFSDMVDLALDGITSLSVKPLRIVTYFGYGLVSLSISAIIIMFIVSFIGFNVTWYPYLIALILFLLITEILALGILGEYVGIISDEVKDRPLYIVGKEIGFEEKSRKGGK